MVYILNPKKAEEAMYWMTEHYLLLQIEAGKWFPQVAGVVNDHTRYHLLPVSPEAKEQLKVQSDKKAPNLSRLAIDNDDKAFALRFSKKTSTLGEDHLQNLLNFYTEELERELRKRQHSNSDSVLCFEQAA